MTAVHTNDVTCCSDNLHKTTHAATVSAWTCVQVLSMFQPLFKKKKSPLQEENEISGIKMFLVSRNDPE